MATMNQREEIRSIKISPVSKKLLWKIYWMLFLIVVFFIALAGAATQSFVATDGNDSYGWRSDTVWPPSSGIFTESGGATSLIVGCAFSSPNYDQDMTFLRFDTSALPDSIAISGARLLIHTSMVLDNDAKFSIVGDSYDYDGSPATTGDWGIIDSSDSVITHTPLSSVNIGQDQPLDLIVFSGINPMGWTGFRLTIDINNTAPTQNNAVFFASSEHASDAAPRLEVTYTEVPTTQPTPSPTSAPTPQPTSTPSASPTSAPTPQPTQVPTFEPTSSPSLAPSPVCSLVGVQGVSCSMSQNLIIGNVVVNQVEPVDLAGLSVVGNSTLISPNAEVVISGTLLSLIHI